MYGETGIHLISHQLLYFLTTHMEGGWTDLSFMEDGAVAFRETVGDTQILDETNRGKIV